MMLIHHEEVALPEAPPSLLSRLRGGQDELKYRTARFGEALEHFQFLRVSLIPQSLSRPAAIDFTGLRRLVYSCGAGLQRRVVNFGGLRRGS